MLMRRDVPERRKIAFVKKKRIDVVKRHLPEMMLRDRKECAVKMRSVPVESRKKMREEPGLTMRSVNAVRDSNKKRLIVLSASRETKTREDAASKRKTCRSVPNFEKRRKSCAKRSPWKRKRDDASSLLKKRNVVAYCSLKKRKRERRSKLRRSRDAPDSLRKKN